MSTLNLPSAAFLTATERAIHNARAKAEIAIEKILSDLEHATMIRIGEVAVDTQNFEKYSVEIFFRDRTSRS